MRLPPYHVTIPLGTTVRIPLRTTVTIPLGTTVTIRLGTAVTIPLGLRAFREATRNRRALRGSPLARATMG